jgi:diguanylate cyclase (GGDEF)-like protein
MKLFSSTLWGLVAGVLVLAAWVLHRLRVARLVRREKVLSRELREKTQELKEKTAELEQSNALLAETSLTDKLTGLKNPRFVEAAIGLLLAPARKPLRDPEQKTECVAILVADVDGLDKVNDTLGPEAGDTVLQAVADAISASVRGGSVVARWSGDEFLVVARVRFGGEAGALAVRLRNAVASWVTTGTGDAARHVTISIGFSVEPLLRARPHLASFRDHLALAEGALRRAKAAGGNIACGWRVNEDALEAAIALHGEAGAVRVLRKPDEAETAGLIALALEHKEKKDG